MNRMLERLVHGRLEAARREHARLVAQHAAIRDRRAAKADELAAAEENAGADLLVEEVTDAKIKAAAKAFSGLASELRVLDHALAVAAAKVAAAEREVSAIEVEDLIERAEAKHDEIEDMLRRAEPHLAELSAIFGVQFTPVILSAQRSDSGWATRPGARRRPLVLRSPTEVQAGIRGGYLVTRAHELWNEAADLEAEARKRSAKLHMTLALKPRVLSEEQE